MGIYGIFIGIFDCIDFEIVRKKTKFFYWNF